MRVCLAIVGSALVGVASAQSGPLTLDDVIRRVDRNFPKLVGTRLQQNLADAKAREKRGAFDPSFTFSTDSARYNSSSTAGKALEFTTNESAFEVTLPSGLKLFAGQRLNYGLVKSPASSTGSFGEYFIGFKLPLLRGLRINEKNVALQQARLSQPLASQGIDSFRLELFLKTSTLYWDWVAAGQRLEVSRKLVKVAQDRANLLGTVVKKGDAARQLFEEASQEVQRRQGAFLKNEREFVKFSYKLNLLLWEGDDPSQDLPTEKQVALSRDTVAEIPESQLALSLSKADQARPELKALVLTKKILDLDLDLAKNDRLPSLEIALSPGFDLGERGIGNSWKFGVFLSVPLVQNTANGRIDAAKLKIQKLEIDLKFAKQEIRNEILDASNAIALSLKRYQAAMKEYDLALEVERIEIINFKDGGGTLFLVNQRERATAEALTRAIDVYAEYQQAIAAYKAATTEILPTN